MRRDNTYNGLMLKAHSPQIFWGFATKGVTFALFYTLQILLVRKLGLRDYGLWSVFYSVFTVAMIFSCFGLNHSARRYAAEHEGSKEVPLLLRSALKLRLRTSLVFALLWVPAAFLAARLLGYPELGPLFAWSAPLLFLSGFAELFKELFIGLRRIGYNCAQNVVEYGSKIALFAALAACACGASLGGALGAFTGALALAVLCGFALLRPYFGSGAGAGDGSFASVLSAYAVPLLASELVAVTLSEIDTIVLGALRPPEEVGLYSVAKQVMFKAPHLALAVGMGVLPVFAKDERRLPELKPLFAHLMRLNAVVACGAAVLLAWLGGPVLALLFGKESRGAAVFFPLLAPYLLAATSNVYFTYVLEYRGKARAVAGHLGVSLLVSATLLVVLAPQFGAKGAALAMSGGYCVLAFLNWRAVSYLFAAGQSCQSEQAGGEPV